MDLVYRTVDEVNAELEDDVQIDKDTEAVLYGRGAKIDSMTLVSFIVAVEDHLHDELGLSTTLANESAMSMERSPFKTVGSMIDYVVDVVGEAPNA